MTYYRPNVHILPAGSQGSVTLNFFVLAVLLLIIIAYFVEINKIIERNFQLISSQKVFQEQKYRSQNLQTAALQLSSLEKLQEKARAMNLVTVDEIEYLKILSDSFALQPAPLKHK